MSNPTELMQTLTIEPERRELARLHAFARQSDRVVLVYLVLGLGAGYLALAAPLSAAEAAALGFLGGVLVGAGTERLVTRPLRLALRRFLPRGSSARGTGARS